MNRFARPWVPLGLAAFLPLASGAITNVPPGKLVWLQGYDFSPATPGFRNEGTVKLECVDDALHIQLDVATPGMDNAPGGRLLFQPGAGGSRGFSGQLLNLGDVLVNYSATFSVRGTEVDNRSNFLVNPYATVLFAGPEVAFTQTDGTVDCGEKFELRDGLFDWQGGNLRGEPILVRSIFRLAPAITQPFTAHLQGEGASFEGVLRADQNLRVVGSATHGKAKVTSPAPLTLAGTLTLGSVDSPEAVEWNAPGGLLIAQGGVLKAERGAGGGRRISGPVEVLGTLRVEAALELQGATPLIHQGNINVADIGYLSVDGPIIQRAGTTLLSGGTLHTPAAYALEGGSLSGFGTVSGTLTNAAEVSVRQSSRNLLVLGDYWQSPSGNLTVTLGPGQPSQAPPAVIITGTARFAGTIRIVADEGARLTPGTRHALLACHHLHGGLDHIIVPELPTGLHWEFQMDAGTLMAKVADGASHPSLRVDAGTDGVPRLTVADAPPFGFDIEYSPDLSTWIQFTPQVQFLDGAVSLGGLPASLPKASVFFRIAQSR